MPFWESAPTIMAGPILRSRVRVRHIVYAVVGVFITWTLYTSLDIRKVTSYAPQDVPGLEVEDITTGLPLPPLSSWEGRAQAVREAFQHAYHGWEKYAAPADELLPNSKKPINNFNGWGVTMFDALDTMIIMDLKDELSRALPIVKTASFDMDGNKEAAFFETVIRYLGGLLSAYALSNDTLYLHQAEELGSRLEPAFRTESGFPVFSVSTTTGKARGRVTGSLAEIATCQLEYIYLAKATGKREYFKLADRIVKNLARADLNATGGMLPSYFNVTSGDPLGSTLSVGAMADSAHEYLLKYYLLTGREDKTSLEMYLRFTTEVIADLLYVSPYRKMLYVTDVRSLAIKPAHMFEHLSSFIAGLFTLGAHLLPLDDLGSLGIDFAGLAQGLPVRTQEAYKLLAQHKLSDVHRWVAEGIAHTAWLTYADMGTGLAADEVYMYKKDGYTGVLAEPWLDLLKKWTAEGAKGTPPGLDQPAPIVHTAEEKVKGPKHERTHDYSIKKDEYILRPETVESFFLLWKTTGNVKWRERGWAVFEAIQRECRTPIGYASIIRVDESPAQKKDMMPSFFLAETLKYLYLLFIDEDKIPLDRWVFNTEAHPFPIFTWTSEDRKAFGII